MTDAELDRAQRSTQPSRSRRAVRKQKLKMRYGYDVRVLVREIGRAREKLELLIELRDALLTKPGA